MGKILYVKKYFCNILNNCAKIHLNVLSRTVALALYFTVVLFHVDLDM